MIKAYCRELEMMTEGEFDKKSYPCFLCGGKARLYSLEDGKDTGHYLYSAMCSECGITETYYYDEIGTTLKEWNAINAPVESTASKTMSFRDYLKSRENDDCPIGDLACDILNDVCFPIHCDFALQYEYLISKNACSGALVALLDAWHDFIDKSFIYVKKKSFNEELKGATSDDC